MTEEEDFMERHLEPLAADLESLARQRHAQMHMKTMEKMLNAVQAASLETARRMYEYEPEVPALRIIDSIASVVYERDYRIGSK